MPIDEPLDKDFRVTIANKPMVSNQRLRDTATIGEADSRPFAVQESLSRAREDNVEPGYHARPEI